MSNFDIMLSRDEIAARVAELGAQITKDHAGDELHAVAVLKGSFVFLADLVRNIDLPVHIHFLAVHSYAGTESTGQVQLTQDIDEPLEGKNVLLVEDIIDTGLTLRYLFDTLQTRRPKSLRIATLLDKPSRRKVDVTGDYTGFEIPDEFVVGYGLDYNGMYRNLDHVAIFKGD